MCDQGMQRIKESTGGSGIAVKDSIERCVCVTWAEPRAAARTATPPDCGSLSPAWKDAFSNYNQERGKSHVHFILHNMSSV